MAILLALLLLVATLLGFYGDVHWTFEVLAAFRIPYLIVFSLLLFVATLKQRTVLLAVTTVGLIINACLVDEVWAPQTNPRPEQPTRGAYQELTLLQANLYKRNFQHERFKQFVFQTNSDVVVMEEVTKNWYRALAPDKDIQARYRYRFIKPYSQKAIFSKYPLQNTNLKYVLPVYPYDAILVSQVVVKSQPVTIIVIHPVHPTNERRDWQQKVVYNHLINHHNLFSRPLIIAGDYNSTPWSTQFNRLKTALQLKDSRRGFGIQPTWPATSIPVLPIDHVLVSPDIQVLSRKRGPFTGSDHLPVQLKIAVPTTKSALVPLAQESKAVLVQ